VNLRESIQDNLMHIDHIHPDGISFGRETHQNFNLCSVSISSTASPTGLHRYYNGM